MATRRAFNAADVPEHDAPPAGPSRPTFACRANGCQMVGAIQGHCTHHWQAHTHDWPRITQTMRESQVMVDEIRLARQLLVNPEGNPLEQTRGHVEAHRRLLPSLDADEVAFIASKAPKTYNHWVYQVEMLLGARITKVVKRRRDERNHEHPAYANRVRAAQIPGQAADFLNEEGF